MSQNRLLVILLGLCYAVNTLSNHHRQKRFVFYPGSVLQLAAGLAIPADVQHRIIYTNYGIMINYELPTNLSTLLPISLVEQAKSLSPHLTKDFFLRFGLNNNCWRRLKKWADVAENQRDALVLGIAELIIREIEYDAELMELLSTKTSNSSDPSNLPCFFDSLIRGP